MNEKTKYPENSICIMKRGMLGLTINNTQYKPFRMYRVCFDEDKKGCLVYGEWMSIKDFEACFELYVPFLLEKLNELNMIKDGKPLTFKAFKEMVSVHNYGRGVKKLKVMYVGPPKDNCFAFYPMQATQPIALKECYDNYVRLVGGDWEVVDSEDVVWGNSGYPFTYQKIYYR